MKKITILVRNNFINDRRVKNIATFFQDNNYYVKVIALKTYKGLPTKETRIMQIQRIPVFSSIYSNPPSQIKKLTFGEKNKNRIVDAIKNNKFRKIIISFLNSIFFNVGSFFATIVNRPDCIWANDLDTLYVCYLASRICKAKLIYDSHEIFTEGNTFFTYTWIRKFLLRKIENKCINNADAVIVTTNYRKLFLEKKYNIEGINVIKNCYNYEKIENKNLFKKEFKIKKNTKIFLYQGLILRKRGVFTLVDSIKNIQNAVMVFMGNGSDKNELYNYVHEMNCANKVFIKDAVPMEQILDYTASADVGLQLLKNTGINHYSTISNKVFEYIMAEIPVISSNFPELINLIEANEIGIVVEPENTDEIIEAMKEITIESNYNRFKENLLDIKKLYTWEIESMKIHDIIKEIE